MVIDDIETLLESAAEAVGVHKDEILGTSRKTAPSFARQIVMALWSEGHSLEASARVVNRSTHSLVIYARQRIFSRMQSNNATRERVRSVVEIYRQKKARPSQYVHLNFFAELSGFLSPLNPHTETGNTNVESIRAEIKP